MRGNDEETQGFRVKMRQNIAYGKEVAQRLGHFFFVNGNKTVVQPVAYKRMHAGAAFGLGNFVFVVRENQIAAAAVEVKAFTKVFHAHGRAFNMPSRAAFAPRAFPVRFARFGCLPQRKVKRVVLFVVNVDACARHHVFQLAAGQFAVTVKFFHAVINIAVHFVSIALIDKGLHHVNDFRHMLGNARVNMRAADIQHIHFFKINVDIASADIAPRHAFLIGGVDDFVVNVGKVLHMQHVVAFMLQKAADYVPRYKGARIADMRVVVRRNAANIHIGFAGVQRYKFFFLFGERIINLNSHGNCSLI